MKIGIDIVEIRRFARIKKTDYTRWSRVFSLAEWNYCFTDAHAAAHLAGLFAAKEAALKALGKTPKDGLRHFRITHRRGIPEMNIPRAALSISHDGGFAIAVMAIP